MIVAAASSATMRGKGFVGASFVAARARRSTTYHPAASSSRGPLAVPSESDDGLLIPPPGGIPYPDSLSPSSIAEFLECPQSYLFQYLLKIRQPTNPTLAKGTMCHKALERVFDLKCHDRTPQNLRNLMRAAWREARDDEPYDALFRVERDDDDDESSALKRDLEAETRWGREAISLLDNYVALEDPSRIPPPNPIQREIWLNRNLTVDPRRGATGGGREEGEEGGEETFRVRGIVDRVDLLRVHGNDGDGDDVLALRIVDYKTGKAPDFKYSAAMNRKIANKNFFQLKIYALLLREILNDVDGRYGTRAMIEKFLPEEHRGAVDVRTLRLMYLTSSSDEGRFLDMDLGATREERDARLQEVHVTLSRVWREIRELIDAQNATVFKHCDRSFCSCHKVRPTFVKGTVWEKTNSSATTTNNGDLGP